MDTALHILHHHPVCQGMRASPARRIFRIKPRRSGAKWDKPVMPPLPRVKVDVPQFVDGNPVAQKGQGDLPRFL